MFSAIATWSRFGRTSRRFRIPYVAQIATNDCGAACLAMTLRHHGIACDPLALFGRLQPRARGVSASAILAVAREHGLTGRGLQVPASFLRRLATGSILHWRSHHFVVLDSADERGVQIVDPAVGQIRLRWRSVERLFGGTALEFEPVDARDTHDVSSSSSLHRLADAVHPPRTDSMSDRTRTSSPFTRHPSCTVRVRPPRPCIARIAGGGR